MGKYDFDAISLGDQLTPPQLRQPKQSAWIRVLISGVKWCSDLFTDELINGGGHAMYNNGTAYVRLDRATYTDNSVYQNILASTGVKPIGDATSVLHWIKIQNCYIGYDEQLKYTGQTIVLAYAMNRMCRNAATPPFIWVEHAASAGITEINVPLATYNAMGATDPDRNTAILNIALRYTLPGVGVVVTPF